MPISTPESCVGDYGGDTDHFPHVLHELFVPAIEEAGFTAVLPISQGSEIIHSDIIDNLVKADLVFVDMSTLNANVFFEFGIRSALNKPVCLVRDDRTPKIPFDAATANNHTYASSLQSWIVKIERPKLAAHVKTSFERSKGVNSLWQHFGVRAMGEAPKGPTSADDKLDFIMRRLEALSDRDRPAVYADEWRQLDFDHAKELANINMLLSELERSARAFGEVSVVGFDGSTIYAGTENITPERARAFVESLALPLAGYRIEFLSPERLEMNQGRNSALLLAPVKRRRLLKRDPSE